MLVRSIEWGSLMTEDGRAFKDALLWFTGAREWDWTECGTRHRPGIPPLVIEALLSLDCEHVILSRGMDLVLQTSPEAFELLRARKIPHEQLQSRDAVARYNALVRAGVRVGLALHSTC